MEDHELLADYRAVKRGDIVLCDEGAVKRYKLALKGECARRNILPVGDDGEDQNFQLPEAEIIALRTGFGGITSQEQSDPYVGAARPGGGILETEVKRATG